MDDGDAGGLDTGGVFAGHAGLLPRLQVRRQVQGGIHVEQDGALQVNNGFCSAYRIYVGPFAITPYRTG